MNMEDSDKAVSVVKSGDNDVSSEESVMEGTSGLTFPCGSHLGSEEEMNLSEAGNPPNPDEGQQLTLTPIISFPDEEPEIFEIKNVIDKGLLDAIVTDVEKLDLEFNKNDLSNFSQSLDMMKLNYHDENVPSSLWTFITRLKEEIKPLIEEKLMLTCSSDRMTITVSLYRKGDYLLCHDDRFNDRAIAFIFYLNDMSEEDGGQLRFFDHDEDNEPVVDSFRHMLKPKKNTMVLFKVSDTSHHEVQQVMTDTSRWTINGWFHGSGATEGTEQENPNQRLFYKSDVQNMSMLVNPILPMEKMLTETYLEPHTWSVLKKQLRADEHLSILLSEILNQSFYNNCAIELDSSDLLWQMRGPANQRRYQTLDYEIEGGHVSFGESLPNINILVDLLLSQTWLKWLNKLTELEFVEENGVPKCMIEVQKWSEGCYAVLSDINALTKYPSLEVTIVFSVNASLMGSETKIDAKGQSDFSGLLIQNNTNVSRPSADSILYSSKLMKMCTGRRIGTVKERKETVVARRKAMCRSAGKKRKHVATDDSHSDHNANKRLRWRRIIKLRQRSRQHKIRRRESNLRRPVDEDGSVLLSSTDSLVEHKIRRRESNLRRPVDEDGRIVLSSTDSLVEVCNAQYDICLVKREHSACLLDWIKRRYTANSPEERVPDEHRKHIVAYTKHWRLEITQGGEEDAISISSSTESVECNVPSDLHENNSASSDDSIVELTTAEVGHENNSASSDDSIVELTTAEVGHENSSASSDDSIVELTTAEVRDENNSASSDDSIVELTTAEVGHENNSASSDDSIVEITTAEVGHVQEIAEKHRTVTPKKLKLYISLVKEKMNQLKQYRASVKQLQEEPSFSESTETSVNQRISSGQRRSEAETGFGFIEPLDNSLLLSRGTESLSKYTEYIKKKSDPNCESQVAYYAVNVTYFTKQQQ